MKYEKILIWGVALIQSVVTYFLPVLPLLGLVGFFILCDLIMTIAVCMKTIQRIRFWRNVWEQVPKALVYGVVVVVAYVLELQWFPGSNLSKLISGAVALRELRSIDKKFELVTNFSVLTSVIRAMESMGKKKS